MDYWGLALVIAAVILIVIIVIFSESPPAPPPGPPPPPDSTALEPLGPTDITDCSKFGNSVTAASCQPGTVEWRGNCYKDLWTAQGGVKTAVETVYYGPYGEPITKCGIGIYYLDYGAPCTMLGPGYYKTAVCTCQYKGAITSSLYDQYTGKPSTCPDGSDLFQGKCLAEPCPKGYKRIRRCTCAPTS